MLMMVVVMMMIMNDSQVPFKKTCGKLDQALFKHLCNIVEVFCADAAAYEHLAGRLLLTEPGSNAKNADSYAAPSAPFRNS